MQMETKAPLGAATERFPAVDVLKFLFSILIMCLHGQVFKGSPAGMYFEKIIVRLAVPFFFVSSGFFYGRKVYGKKDLLPTAKQYISRLAMKLLLFEPVSVCLRIVQKFWIDGDAFPDVLLDAVRNILFYPRGALWYIQAVIVAVVILVPFMKRGREGIALLIGVMLYPFALLCNRYYFLCEGTVLERIVIAYMRCFISARNGLFMGLLYVSMGVLIAKKWDTLKLKKTMHTVLMIVSGLCLVLEVCFTNNKTGMDDNALFVSHLVLIPALFLCAGCRKTVWPVKDAFAATLRNLSTSIYLLHSPVLQIIKLSCGNVFHVQLQPWQITAMAGAAVALICTAVYRKKWNPLYNWIK